MRKKTFFTIGKWGCLKKVSRIGVHTTKLRIMAVGFLPLGTHTNSTLMGHPEVILERLALGAFCATMKVIP